MFNLAVHGLGRFSPITFKKCIIMKKAPHNNPSVPHYASFLENDAPNIGFLFNDDALSPNHPYKLDEVIIGEEVMGSPINNDQIKVCYEIGNSSEIEDAYDIVIEDSIMPYSENDQEDEPLM